MTAPERVPESFERVLSLSEVAQRLGMKRPNVAKFLARRGVRPRLEKAQGYFWAEADIERVKAEREADEERLAADRKRREAARRNARREGKPLPVRLGVTQRDLLAQMLRRPGLPVEDKTRLALKRLEDRGFVEPVPGEDRVFRLTERGREIAGLL